MIIDGEERTASSGATLESIDPASGAVVAVVAAGDAGDIDAAVAASRRALPAWRATAAAERGRVLRRISDLIAANADRLAELESLDTGKPLTQARADVVVAARYFEYYAGAADKLMGETIPVSDDVFAYTVREPHGVTGHIVPWNYPLQIASRSIAPALAAGNAPVLKPAEETPCTAIELGRLALEAGLPVGVLNVVPGFGETAGAALSAHQGVDHLSFTGSPEVGRLVMHAAADRLAPVGLELGGKSPQIVLPGANLDLAAPAILKAIIQNAGQTCSAGSRVIVHASLEAELLDRLRALFAKVSIGRGLDDPDLGPLVTTGQQTRVLGYIEAGKSSGAQLLCGGGVPDGMERGAFVEPTIFVNVDANSAIANEEIFGPVLSVLTCQSTQDALAMANNSRFGLVGAVWTSDIDAAMWVASRLEVGQVFINTYGAGGGVELPFGGRKESGFGREKGWEGLLAFTTTKTVAMRVTPRFSR
ncbi:MAG: aldehyde dehydrogenase family protein [Acidimicrobiia bacterium]